MWSLHLLILTVAGVIRSITLAIDEALLHYIIVSLCTSSNMSDVLGRRWPWGRFMMTVIQTLHL